MVNMSSRPARWCAKCRASHAGKCPNAVPWVKPVAVKSGRGGRPWQRLRKAIFERDGYICQIHLRKGVVCVVTLHGSLAGICDHIIPVAEGGSDSPENLQTICQECDREKTQLESQRGRGVLKV